MTLTRPELAVSIAVFRDGKILLASRTAEPAKGLFSLPGGRVERGETLQDAALRELLEEVGVEAKIAGFVDHIEVRDMSPDGTVRFHAVICVFAAEWHAGEGLCGPEAGEVLWVSPEKIGNLPVTKGLAGVVAKAAIVLKQRA